MSDPGIITVTLDGPVVAIEVPGLLGPRVLRTLLALHLIPQAP
jgi:hypothetical protein